MITRELFSIRVETNLQTMEMTSWWRNLLPFFLALAILRETSMEWTSMKTFNVILKKKANKQTSQQQFSMVCTLIDHRSRNDVKMFKTLRWNH